MPKSMMIRKYVFLQSVRHSLRDSPQRFLRLAPVVKERATVGTTFLLKKEGTKVSFELSASFGFLNNNFLGLEVKEK